MLMKTSPDRALGQDLGFDYDTQLLAGLVYRLWE